LENRLTLLSRGGGIGGRINHAAGQGSRPREREHGSRSTSDKRRTDPSPNTAIASRAGLPLFARTEGLVCWAVDEEGVAHERASRRSRSWPSNRAAAAVGAIGRRQRTRQIGCSSERKSSRPPRARRHGVIGRYHRAGSSASRTSGSVASVLLVVRWGAGSWSARAHAPLRRAAAEPETSWAVAAVSASQHDAVRRAAAPLRFMEARAVSFGLPGVTILVSMGVSRACVKRDEAERRSSPERSQENVLSGIRRCPRRLRRSRLDSRSGDCVRE
jgi:hypothetical protein